LPAPDVISSSRQRVVSRAKGRECQSTRTIVIVRRIGAAIQSGTISAAKDALHPDVAWHYFNPRLPEVAGDYHGASGIERFFALLASKSNERSTSSRWQRTHSAAS
jgi:hypothetical protein